jgi:Kdo2-lipid IVA lauroyltransferase/acyltransferase
MAERGSFTLFVDSMIGALAAGILGGVKRLDRRRTANFAGALLRKVGPFLPEHRIGRDNLRTAFPEKSDADIEQILAGVWDNLGRVTVEFAHLDEFCIAGLGPQTADVITYRPEMEARLAELTQSGQAALFFAAHLANWEIPAIGAKAVGAKAAILYRRPNIAPVGDLIVKLRTPLMGELIPNGLSAPLQLARRAAAGVNVGMLVDQHFTKGVEVIFFGRRCMANPLIALLARQTECPIRGMRAIRRADGNSFSLEMTAPIEPVRDTEGRVDVARTMQRITTVVEGWIRENPAQWLWLHRRWR